VERTADVTLGPLFTLGAVLIGIGAVKRSLPLVVAGAAAIVADQRLPASQRLKDRIRERVSHA
jgi:hypothetical protein